MTSSNITITSPNFSELKLFRPLVKNVLENVDQTYIKNKKIPCWLLPSSGKEVAMTPLFYHAAFDAYAQNKVSYIPSAEIQVPRGISKGRLDLALIGNKHIELIELKASRVKLFGSVATIINKLKSKQFEAQTQLEQIDHSEITKTTDLETKDLTIVTLFLLAPEKKAFETKDVKTKIKEVMNELKVACPYALRASLSYSYIHQINSDSSKSKGEHTVGMIIVASRTVDIY
ncbi:hypothetical protein [Pseudoalteromonas byunsanensis]|uniref:Uncharacterized protein n=1 Tax=Pseudoalteromonas byunsanensis TaxID=327939 RepID=A0A1S1N815_9GAMM|nr:hypothetical protein [Pseudoalteromonas byunsanensis]OHU94404.1 hypothetical protein BIW53_15110 [Pseudoalteromonas byunsanensis]